MKCIAAHTTLAYKTYPAYINASRQGDGSVRVIVRSQEGVSEAAIVLSDTDWERFVSESATEIKSIPPKASA